jgi:hypothetical protein
MATLGRRPSNAALTSADIPDDSITAAKIVAGAVSSDVVYLENATAAQELSGTYSTERLYFNDSYQLTGDVTVTGHLALGTIADADVVITQDSTERTITGSGTLEAGNVLQDTHGTDLTGMTGELGSVVTGSPALNLTNATFPAGAVVKHQKVLTAISSYQVGTNSYADITGSSITYTPATGADYIVYECSFVSSADDQASPLFAFRFLINGTITKNQDSYAPYANPMGTQWSSIRQTHKMVYSASGWTTGKPVKMQFRRYNTGNQARLHFQAYDYLTADGSSMGSTDRFTDVITTIYSVMA